MDQISIVCTCDNKYCQHFAALMSSVFENNKSEDVRVFLVTNFIDESNKKKIQALSSSYGRELQILEIDEGRFNGLPFGGKFPHISIATFFRLLIPEVIPQCIDKILYLDCDIIVMDNLRSLWDIDLTDVALAGMEDCTLMTKSSPSRLGYPSIYSYFNAGVLLLNLDYLRKMDFVEKFSEYVELYCDKILYHDQDILNALLYDKKRLLPIKWNVMDCFLYKRPPIDRKYISELREAKLRPSIIHYSGFPKPWHKESKHPYKDLYWRYLSLTEYKNELPELVFPTLRLKCIHAAKITLKWIIDHLYLHSYLYDPFISSNRVF